MPEAEPGPAAKTTPTPKTKALRKADDSPALKKAKTEGRKTAAAPGTALLLAVRATVLDLRPGRPAPGLAGAPGPPPIHTTPGPAAPEPEEVPTESIKLNGTLTKECELVRGSGEVEVGLGRRRAAGAVPPRAMCLASWRAWKRRAPSTAGNAIPLHSANHDVRIRGLGKPTP